VPERDRTKYARDGQRYAEQVAAGKILAGKYVILACQRHLDDLKKQDDPTFPYFFDAEAAGKVCAFGELMQHTKGKWAARKAGDPLSNLIKLELWQRFFFCCIFGWKRKSDGLRRFSEVYACIPRKNGKSIMAAIIGLYMFTADGEFGAEIYSGATTEKQAWEVFRPAKQMVDRSAAFRKRAKIRSRAKALEIEHNGSRFEPIIGNPGDGSSPSCALIDEYHEHDSNALYNTMLDGMGARDQPLAVVITTAGSNIASPCYLLQQEVQKMLEGALQMDDVFGIVYSIDPEDDWTTEAALRKANPNFDISTRGDKLLAEQKKAIQTSRRQNTFKTKKLNLWVQARTAWMNMVAWGRCGDPGLRLEDFEGEECWIGIDLASKLDITSVVLLFKRHWDEDDKDHWYCFGRHYLPEDKVEETDNEHYQKWTTQGHLLTTDGNIIDLKRIEADIIGHGDYPEAQPDCDRFVIVGVGYDPFGATALAQNLQDEKQLDVEEVKQRAAYLSEPMKWIEALVVGGQFHHDDNPVMNWMISNVTAKEFADGTVFPNKDNADNKIDGPVATMIAGAIAWEGEDSTSVYNTRGIRTF
jgi:phage terminase large subunit-like protein